MPICGHPTKNGTLCKRKSPYCWQHRLRWRLGIAFVVTALSVLSIFVEIPRIKIGFPAPVSNAVSSPPYGLTAVVTYGPSEPSITPSDRILTVDSATTKAGSLPTKVIHPMTPQNLEVVAH